uniref:Large ribosomal subunit protein uL10 n=1 Tax=Saimiri boliviensis boliviensis TaxID=39432 RepID=A0A2K6TRS7_SAIBB
MPRENRATWKSNYFLKIIQLLDDYLKCNVGSKQMQQSNMSLCGKAVVLMGHLENNPALEKLLPHIWGNVGFVFTKEDLTEIKDMLLANKVPATARAGAIAPCEVTVPAQNTGMGPEKTSFFQALSITTKIFRGTVEILNMILSPLFILDIVVEDQLPIYMDLIVGSPLCSIGLYINFYANIILCLYLTKELKDVCTVTSYY